MKIPTSSAFVCIHSSGSNVFVESITPAEALLLREIHDLAAGRVSVTLWKQNPQVAPTVKVVAPAPVKVPTSTTDTTGFLPVDTRIVYPTLVPVPITGPFVEVERSLGQELSRLKARFGSKLVEHAFPGSAPTLPATFQDALSKEIVTEESESGLH